MVQAWRARRRAAGLPRDVGLGRGGSGDARKEGRREAGPWEEEEGERQMSMAVGLSQAVSPLTGRAVP